MQNRSQEIAFYNIKSAKRSCLLGSSEFELSRSLSSIPIVVK